MSAFAAGAVQVAGVALAPLLPGTIQTLKARLQGRRGASALQPYRVLRRLWGKSAVDPEGSGPVYQVAPAVVVAALLVALTLLPIAGDSGDWPFGNDALALVGLLALARFAIAAAAWDPGNGFALMGSARDLTLAVFAEALLVLALLLAALPAQSTDLLAMSDAAAGSEIWREPAHWCAGLAFALVILAETGRQPIDNPDTHLELTMIHEGPLLEYAGRDLALLHWAAAARHWIVLVLAAELFVPHPSGVGGRLAVLAVALGVVVVRRRSLAIALVAAQSAALGLGALDLASERGSEFLVASLVLVTKAIVLPALLLAAMHRTREPRLVAPAVPALARLVVAGALALAAAALVPPLGLGDDQVEQTAVALVLVGIAVVVMRRPALLQVTGIVVAENGVALLAISVPGGLSYVVELGALFDLVLVVTVASAFVQRIYTELGSGDTELLRGLRD